MQSTDFQTKNIAEAVRTVMGIVAEEAPAANDPSTKIYVDDDKASAGVTEDGSFVCPNCGGTETETIGGELLCSSCGQDAELKEGADRSWLKKGAKAKFTFDAAESMASDADWGSVLKAAKKADGKVGTITSGSEDDGYADIKFSDGTSLEMVSTVHFTPAGVNEATYSADEVEDKIQAIFARFEITPQEDEDMEDTISRLADKNKLAAAQVRSLMKESFGVGLENVDAEGELEFQDLHDDNTEEVDNLDPEIPELELEDDNEGTRPVGGKPADVKIDGVKYAADLAKDADGGKKQVPHNSAGLKAADAKVGLKDTTKGGAPSAKAPKAGESRNTSPDALSDTTKGGSGKAVAPMGKGVVKEGYEASDVEELDDDTFMVLVSDWNYPGVTDDNYYGVNVIFNSNWEVTDLDYANGDKVAAEQSRRDKDKIIAVAKAAMEKADFN